MKFGELKAQFPELVAHAIVASNVRDDAEVTVIEEETPAPQPGTPEEKDRQISDLTSQLQETNKQLAEMLHGKDKDSQKTDITINIEGAKAGKRGTNPLTLAYLRRKQK